MTIEKIGSIFRARLNNALTVVVAENHAAPVVAIQVWLDVGSADETPGEEGLAHLHEHMLFKGTETRGVGEIARLIESAGGEINAWTSFDHTVYHVVLASRFSDLGMEVLADAVQRASFDAVELEREKRVVLEEINRTRDMPGRWLGDLLFTTAFRRHPYGHPVLGNAKSVGAVTRKSIWSFFRRHYRPSRMTLVVAGDVEHKEVVKRAGRLFGRAPVEARTARPKRTPEPRQTQMRVRVARDDIQEVHFGLAWHIPGVTHTDVPALDLLATLLGQGESSRLILNLKRGLNLVNDIYAYAYTPADPGLFALGGTCRSEKLEQTLKQVAFEMGRLTKVPVGTAELAKVKSMVESDALYMRETVQGLARRIGYYQVLMDDPNYGDRYLSQVLSLTPEDLMRSAATYLRPERASVVLLVPQEQHPGLDRTAVRRAIHEGQQRAASSEAIGTKAERGITRVKIRNGPVVLIQEDHTNALVALRAVFLGGIRYETEEISGINNFLAGLLTRGTASRSADDIAREVDNIAGAIEGFSGRNTFGLRAELPARHIDRGLALFADCLLNPTFLDEEIRRERELTLASIASREDNLSGLAFDLFAATLFDSHPYRLTVLGTRKSVAALRRQQMREYYRRHYSPDRVVLSVVGDVDRDRVLDQVRALFVARPARRRSGPAPKLALDPRPGAIRVAVKHRSRAQAHLVLGFLGTTLGSGDRYALEVLMAVLAGQGGRLFAELRDKRSLAYAVTGFSLEGIEPGYLAVYLAIDPKRAAEAHDAVLEQLRRVVEKPIPVKELQRAQRYLVGTHAISLQRASARAASLAFNELYGLGYLVHLQYPARIMAITQQDLRRVARKYLRLDAYTLSVVGPQDQLPDLPDG